MSETKRKFIESHWLTFAVKGAVSLIAGLCMMFTVKADMGYLDLRRGLCLNLPRRNRSRKRDSSHSSSSELEFPICTRFD